MPIYTKTGDKGETSLADGRRVRKCCTRVESYGTIDELSSYLGLLIAKMNGNTTSDVATIIPDLISIQNDLFNISSELAGVHTTGYDESIEKLEHRIDDMNLSLPTLHEFILPGGTECAAIAHICRTICRRAERCIITLAETETVNEHIIVYINRLSDYLFMLAKKLNFIAGVKENTWQKTCK